MVGALVQAYMLIITKDNSESDSSKKDKIEESQKPASRILENTGKIVGISFSLILLFRIVIFLIKNEEHLKTNYIYMVFILLNILMIMASSFFYIYKVIKFLLINRRDEDVKFGEDEKNSIFYSFAYFVYIYMESNKTRILNGLREINQNMFDFIYTSFKFTVTFIVLFYMIAMLLITILNIRTIKVSSRSKCFLLIDAIKPRFIKFFNIPKKYYRFLLMKMIVILKFLKSY